LDKAVQEKVAPRHVYVTFGQLKLAQTPQQVVTIEAVSTPLIGLRQNHIAAAPHHKKLMFTLLVINYTC